MGEKFGADRGQFFKDFTSYEVVARGFLGLRWWMAVWTLAVVKRGIDGSS
jgi:hypothetical protein